MGTHEAVTGHELIGGRYCPVCDGPCRVPRPVFPIHEGYPFLPPEEIARVNAAAEPANDAEPVDPTPRVGRRMRRPAEDRARRLDEDRMRRPTEDR